MGPRLSRRSLSPINRCSKMKRRQSEHRSTALTVSGERQVPLVDSSFFSHECTVCVWRHSASHSPVFSLPDLWQSLCLMALVLETNSAKVKSQAISFFQPSLPLDAPCHQPWSLLSNKTFPALVSKYFKRLKVSFQCAKPEQKIVVDFMCVCVCEREILIVVRNKYFPCSQKPRS